MKLYNVLNIIERCIIENSYRSVETNRIELKDLSSGDNWTELYKTACAYLNTEGGIIIVGIKEKVNAKYILTGYNSNDEPKLKDLLPAAFTNEKGEKLTLKDFFPPLKIINFLGKQICIIYVEKLPEDKKYVYYKGKAWERKGTGDHKISQENIQRQRELIQELVGARELDEVPNTKLADLNIDKLNEFIVLLNRDIKVETYKADHANAMSFLERKGMIRNGKPTYLGMLVCGEHVADFIGKLAEVDGYVDLPDNQLITHNKQVIKDNIIPLMERSIGFVYKNIQVGVSIVKGGQEQPEYPEKLIRETINNALAHRNYRIDDFITIVIRPNQSIEISNPGNFRNEQQIIIRNQQEVIQRIVPIPKPRNPKLADILKVFDRWEGRGIGMASLTNACLDNEIDLPYYMLPSENKISLTIPKGQLIDEQIEHWLSIFSKFIYQKNNGRELSEEEKRVLAYFYKAEKLNKVNRYTILLTADNNHFNVIAKLKDSKLIYLHPDSPRIHPIYLVDRTLLKETYSTELRAIFGGTYDDLSNDYKEILDVIYQHNTYSLKETVSANTVGNFLYRKKYAIIQDISDFESFKRGIRYRFNKLEDKDFISRKDGKKPNFIINKGVERTPSLFDNLMR